MGAIKLKVEIRGIRKLQRRLRTDVLLGQGWMRRLEQAAVIVETLARRRAPRGASGGLAAALKHKLQNRPVPMWARVSASRQRKGFRYGWALNFSQKRVYHYRSGPNTGRVTYGWFTGAMGEARGQIEPLLLGAAREIEQNWGAP